MRIKTLEMCGFKSFVDRTTINFEECITGIVGPNGCGKSNLVDAIRWVMGEMSAKHLRGSEMADVIFNGCETRPPVGMSQVFLTFDNSDGRAPAEYAAYSEIQVGRRLYRSGESEYFINKTPCRLKDIVDFFLGTGVGTKAYSIVEQGMVSHIVHARPEERRMLIEEAAGISKFKSRKEAAIRKMESTRQNLARLTDVLAELTRQMNSLNRQAKKAERYKHIAEELKDRELTLAATRFHRLRAELEGLAEGNSSLKELKVASAAELAGLETGVETERLTMAEVEGQLDGLQQDIYRARNTIKLCEAGIGHKEKESVTIRQQMLGHLAELDVLKERLKELSAKIGDANEQVVAADLMLAGSVGEVESRSALVKSLELKCDELRLKRDGLNKQIASDGEAIANFTTSQEHLDRRRVDITGRVAKGQAEIDAIDRRRLRIDDELSNRLRDLCAVRQLKLSVEEESQSVLSTLEAQRAELAGAEERVKALGEGLSDKRSRLKTLKELRENLEGFRDGVRAVLTRKGDSIGGLAGVVGTVSELVDTTPEFETAVSAALGEKLQYVVVKSHEEGVEAISYLKEAVRGRGTFIPMELRLATDAQDREPSGEGVVGPLVNYVRFHDDYRQIGRYLLGDVVLVDDLPRALCLWQTGDYQRTFVTRDGCVVDPSGVVTGGAGTDVEEQLLTQRRKISGLEEEISTLGAEFCRAEGEAAKIRERVKILEGQVEKLRHDAHERDIKAFGQERDVDHLREESARLEKERDALTVELAQLAAELGKIDHECAEIDAHCEQRVAGREQAQSELDKVSIEIQSLTEELKARGTELLRYKVGLAQAEERASSSSRELEGLIGAKVEAFVGIGRRRGDINMAKECLVILGREIAGLHDDLDLAIRSVTKLEVTQREMTGRYETIQTGLRDREISIRDARKRHDEALARLHEAELGLTEQRGKLNALVDSIRDRYRLDIASIEGEYCRDDLNDVEEEAAVTTLKDKIEKMGPVNVDAIAEFGEISERHKFLSAQHADLIASLENLSKAIAKINRTSRQRFRRAFDLVDEQFQMLFPRLFCGGKARLMLTDDENLLETGVEIIAQPPGKKLQSISLLSGGEKALTAVALIFSIFLIKPSPFCLLDEVDAPLDDANIDRFNDLIRSMIPHSQFILITHNKRTMEQADLLYGVTMEEAGVSKMVSVRLGDEDKVVDSQVA